MTSPAARTKADLDRFGAWARDLHVLHDAWGLQPRLLCRIPSDENLVFQALVGGRRVALRGSAARHRTPERVLRELEVIRGLDSAGVPVARPVTAAATSPDTGITWTAFEWIDGPSAGDMTSEDCRRWGESAAALNDVLASLPVLSGATRMAEDVRYRFSEWLSADDPLLPRAMLALEQMLAPGADDLVPTHGDPTPDNYRNGEGSITWFDFDDWGAAPAERDLAVALTWLARRHGCRPPADLVAALLEGYDARSSHEMRPDVLTWSLEVQLVESLATQSRVGQSLPTKERVAIRDCVRTRRFASWLDLGGSS